MTQRVYISGPISGMPNLNRSAFETAAHALRALGYTPVNPHDNGLPEAASWEQHMRADIRLMLDCDAVALLPHYQTSRGAMTEMTLAQSLGMPVRRIEEWT